MCGVRYWSEIKGRVSLRGCPPVGLCTLYDDSPEKTWPKVDTANALRKRVGYSREEDKRGQHRELGHGKDMHGRC